MNLFFTRLKRLFSYSRLCPYIWQSQKRIAEQVEPLGWKSHLLNNAGTSSLSLYWLSRAVCFTRVGFSCTTDKREEGEIHANQTAFLMKTIHLKLKTRMQYFGCLERGRNPEKLGLGTSRKWNARTAKPFLVPSSASTPSGQGAPSRCVRVSCCGARTGDNNGGVETVLLHLCLTVLLHLCLSPKPPCYLNAVSVSAMEPAWLPR